MFIKTVLIIDSDEFERRILAEDLFSKGHRVYEATDEVEALDLILGLGFSSELDYIIDFNFYIRSNVMNILLKVAAKKFMNEPELITDALKLAQKIELPKKPFDESFSISSSQ